MNKDVQLLVEAYDVVRESMINYLDREQKLKLRKLKDVSEEVKAIIYSGNKGGVEMATQFFKDVSLYGMYEALLYVKGYESQGLYEPGTAEKAVNAALFPKDSEEQKLPPNWHSPLK